MGGRRTGKARGSPPQSQNRADALGDLTSPGHRWSILHGTHVPWRKVKSKKNSMFSITDVIPELHSSRKSGLMSVRRRLQALTLIRHSLLYVCPSLAQTGRYAIGHTPPGPVPPQRHTGRRVSASTWQTWPTAHSTPEHGSTYTQSRMHSYM